MKVWRQRPIPIRDKTNRGGGNLLVSHDGHNQHDDPHHNEDNMEVVLDVGM